jgi:hypothetical protein
MVDYAAASRFKGRSKGHTAVTVARHYVATGKSVVAEQRKRVALFRLLGLPTEEAERTLRVLETLLTELEGCERALRRHVGNSTRATSSSRRVTGNDTGAPDPQVH